MKDPNNPLKRRARRGRVDDGGARGHPLDAPRAPGGRVRPRARHARAVAAALLRRYWSEGQDLWQWDTLRGAAQEAGLDPRRCSGRVEEGHYRQVVEDAVREAQEMGIQAVPTFVLGDRFALQGAQEYAVFQQAMQRLGVKPRPRPG